MKNQSPYNMILFVLFIILLIFCILYYLYYGVDMSYLHFDSDTNNKRMVKKLNEKFFNVLTQEEVLKNYNDVLALNEYLVQSTNDDKANIPKILNDVKTKGKLLHKDTIDILTNMFLLKYLDRVKEKNASSYREYTKWENNTDTYEYPLSVG